MRAFKTFYGVISFFLLVSQAGFLSMLVYTKIRTGAILYYGNSDEPVIGYENYFKALLIWLYATFALMVIWALLTPLAVLSNKRSSPKNKIDILTGVVSFLIAILLLIIDPFGIFKWFTS